MCYWRGALFISKSSIQFQGHTAKKNIDFDPNRAFQDCSFTLDSPMALKSCTKFDLVKKSYPIIFQSLPLNFNVTWDKKRQFWPEFSISGLYLHFEITHGFEVIHKTWHGVEEFPSCFSRSSIKC